MVLGGMTCMWSSMDGGLIDYDFWRINIIVVEFIYVVS